MENMFYTDLHLHFDGSLSLNIVEALLKLDCNKDKKPQGWDGKSKKDKENMLCVPEECESLVDYLKCFDLSCSLLQTPEAVKLAMKMLVEELDRQGLVYAEIRFAPQLSSADLKNSLLNGENRELTEDEQLKLKEHERTIIQAALDGIKEAKTTNLEANLILCCMRNKNWGSPEEGKKANIRTIQLAKEFDKKQGSPRVVRVDIAGGEAKNPNSDYKSEYEAYKDCENIKLTIHSGEAGNLEEKLNNIELAIKAGANIGHGVALACVYDDETPLPLKEKAIELIRQIKEKGIKLEVCITSNYQTKAVSYPHPILKLMLGDQKNGIPDLMENITINTDNMTVSKTTMEEEYNKFIKICRMASLDEAKIEELVIQLQKNGIEASSMNPDRKRDLLACLDAKMSVIQSRIESADIKNSITKI